MKVDSVVQFACSIISFADKPAILALEVDAKRVEWPVMVLKYQIV